jgi:hypothetical protein
MPIRAENRKDTKVTRKEIDICSDCLMASANGLGSVENAPDTFAERYAKGLKEWRGEPYAISDPDTGELDGGFSWHPCEFCDEALGGDRFRASIMETVEVE